MSSQSERGAAAVEFAIVLPLLLMLVLGIVEFSRAYNVQITLTNAAREGARTMAIKEDKAAARTAAKTAASHLQPALADADIQFLEYSPDQCPNGKQMTVTVRYKSKTLTGISAAFDLAGRGTMLCGG